MHQKLKLQIIMIRLLLTSDNNNKLLDMEEDKLDYDLDLENYANDMI